MSNTFSQIYLQFVFAVKGRQSLIPKSNKEELHKYITSLVQSRKAKMLAINCMIDHTHLFVGLKWKVMSVLNQKNGIQAILAGRKDMVFFLTAIHKLIEFVNMY